MISRRLDRFVTFRRRETIQRAGGNTKGDYKDFLSVFAHYRELSAREIANNGMAEDVPTALLTVRDSSEARGITHEDRVTIDGQDFAIHNVSLPDRSGWLYLRVSRTMSG